MLGLGVLGLIPEWLLLLDAENRALIQRVALEFVPVKFKQTKCLRLRTLNMTQNNEHSLIHQ
jgi:hypothetical protein